MSGVLYIDGIGIVGPGFDHWAEARRIFRGTEYVARPYVVPRPKVMNDALVRRANAQILLGVAVAEQAAAGAGIATGELATIFCASEGDGTTAHEVCTTVTGPDPSVSPTRFHNSVHNAPAGNWAIANRCQAPSTSLAAHDSSFTAGLIEAYAQVSIEQRPLLLVTHDTKSPPVIDEIRTLYSSFGVALVLSPSPGPHSDASLRCRLVPHTGDETGMQHPELERLRRGNPAGRALPILELVARESAGLVRLPFTDDLDFEVEVAPCR